jgi:hypothetical protein
MPFSLVPRAALTALVVTAVLSGLIALVVLDGGNLVASGVFALMASINLASFFWFRRVPRTPATGAWKGVYSNEYHRRVGSIALVVLVAACGLAYRAVGYLRVDSPLQGVIAVVGALCLALIGLGGLATIVAARRLRVGRGGRFSKKWIRKDLQLDVVGRSDQSDQKP